MIAVHLFPEEAEFIKRCRAICAELGTIQPAVICGYVARPSIRVYDGYGVRICCEENSSMMEIVVLPSIHPNNLENPVVMIMEDGECIRTHGEYRHAKDEVDRLFESLPTVPK